MTAPLWLPGIEYVKSSNNGGSMTGSDAYFTWHTYECDYSVSATAGAKSLINAGNEVHFCLNPITGELVQILPADVAGRGLQNQSGGVQTNRQGRVNFQVEVIGRASRPWTQDVTAAGRAAVAKLIAFADQWGVPRTHPNGDQGPATSGSPTNRSVTGWSGPGGYFCHAQVPENDHWDHGAVKFTDLWAIADAINNPPEDDMTPDELLDYDTIPSPMMGPDNPNVTVRSALSFAMQWSLAGRNAAQSAARDAAAALEVVKALAAKGEPLSADETAAAAQKGAQAALDSTIDQAKVELAVNP